MAIASLRMVRMSLKVVIWFAMGSLCGTSIGQAAVTSVPDEAERSSRLELLEKELLGEPTVAMTSSADCTSEGELQQNFVRTGSQVVIHFAVVGQVEIRSWKAVLQGHEQGTERTLTTSIQSGELKPGSYSLVIPTGELSCSDCYLKLVIVQRDSTSLSYCAPVSVVSARFD